MILDDYYMKHILYFWLEPQMLNDSLTPNSA